jgi:hydrogenase maturation factor
MCLTVPKQVASVKENYVEVRSNGRKTQKVGTILKVKAGDWVLTQNGIITGKITKKQAQEIIKIFNDKK